ncbi:MAG: hypothetical protein PUC25_02580, partial [Prevotellaceae bacterium]|nr:hypothetical protein [Prevotellaceae bacterium]
RAMLRNKMRIRLKSNDFSPAINDYLVDNPETVEALLNSDRLVVLFTLLAHNESLPLTYDNLLFLINRIDINDEKLIAMESEETRSTLERFLES